MFGPAATQHAEPGSYPPYFQRAFERGLRRADGPRNPFLAHVLLGAYLPDDAPDYVHAARALDVQLVQGQLPDVAGPRSLRRRQPLERLRLVGRRPRRSVGGRPRARASPGRHGRHAGNSTTVATCGRLFGDAFAFDGALGDDLLARDRSLFYERIEVATRRP